MAEWADFANYENLAALVCRSPFLPIEGLRQAINERIAFIRDTTNANLPEMQINRPWFNEDVYPDAEDDIGDFIPEGDAIQVLRDKVKEYCVNFVAYPLVNYSFEGYDISTFRNFDNPPNYNWTYGTLLAYVKTKWEYYQNKYPNEGQEPHAKSTAEWVQLLYHMINEMRAVHVFESFSPIISQIGYAHSSWTKPTTSKNTSWAVVKNELLNSQWEIGSGSAIYHLTSWKDLFGRYWVQDCVVPRVAFKRIPDAGAVVDTYIQPSRQDFRWRQIPAETSPFPGPGVGDKLYPMRYNVKVTSDNPVFDTIEKEGFEIWVEQAPSVTGTFPDNPWQVGNDPFWRQSKGAGYINIGTLFFDFRNYFDKV